MALIYDASAQNLLDLQANSSKYGLLIPNRLFVGALGDDVTEADLKNFFSTYGPVKHCKVLIDANGNSKGYGFVTFVHSEDVDKLLKKTDELLIKNKKINIGPAVRKQGVKQPQTNAESQSLTPQIMVTQPNIFLANNMPYLLQSPPTAIVDANSSFQHHMGLMGNSGATLRQPQMQFMLLSPHEQQLINNQQITQRAAQPMPAQPIITSGVYCQQQKKQQPQLYIPSMTPSFMPGSLDQCLYQLPLAHQQPLHFQQPQQIHYQQLQQQNINDPIAIDVLQSQPQMLDHEQFMLAQNKAYGGGSVQYMADMKMKRTVGDLQQPSQATFVKTSSQNNSISLEARRGLKRSQKPEQNDGSVEDPLYAVPAAKVMARESRSAVISSETSEENAVLS